MGNLPLIKDYAWSEDDYEVSKTMQNYFANFIKTGNPNGADLPNWPVVDSQSLNPPVMVIDVESIVVNASDDARFLFWDKMYMNSK